jgi:hypothetical protein
MSTKTRHPHKLWRALLRQGLNISLEDAEQIPDTLASEVSSSPDLSGIFLIALNSRVY